MTEGATQTAASSSAGIAILRAPEELDLATADGLAAGLRHRRPCRVAVARSGQPVLLRRSWAQRPGPDRQPGRQGRMPLGAHRATAAGGESAAHLRARPTATHVRHHRPRRGGPNGRASTGVTPVISSPRSQSCATPGPSATPASSGARRRSSARQADRPRGETATSPTARARCLASPPSRSRTTARTKNNLRRPADLGGRWRLGDPRWRRPDQIAMRATHRRPDLPM
jgi:hypothetical protein